jgi:Uma2 family endonuclease
MTIATDRRYTAEEFLALPLDGVWELIDGVPVEKKMGNRSNKVALRLAVMMTAQLEERGHGIVITECWLRCWPADPDRVRRPDVAFLASHLLPPGELPDILSVAPTLAVESVSPSNSADEIEEKTREYFDAGVPLVWVLYPKQQTVRAHKPDGTTRLYRGEETFAGEPLLPGLTFRISDLFAAANTR